MGLHGVVASLAERNSDGFDSRMLHQMWLFGRLSHGKKTANLHREIHSASLDRVIIGQVENHVIMAAMWRQYKTMRIIGVTG